MATRNIGRRLHIKIHKKYRLPHFRTDHENMKTIYFLIFMISLNILLKYLQFVFVKYPYNTLIYAFQIVLYLQDKPVH